jgi:hypothetical protein
MRHTPLRAHRAVTLMEICIAVTILILAMVPIFTLTTGGRERATMSESQVYAELYSARITEDLSTRHYGYLYRSGSQQDWFGDMRRIDAASMGNAAEWGNDPLIEYVKNATEGFRPITGQVDVVKVGDGTPGAGLMSIEVIARWKNLHRSGGDADLKDSTMALIRFRGKRDYSLRSIREAEL